MKIILIGDNYYRRTYDPLVYLGYNITLIRYNFKVSKFVQPFMYFYKIIQTFFYTFVFNPDIVIITNPSYISFFTIDFFRLMKRKSFMRIGADLKNDFHLALECYSRNYIKKYLKYMQKIMCEYSIKKVDIILTSSEFVKAEIRKGYCIFNKNIYSVYSPVSRIDNPIKFDSRKNIILSVTQFNNPYKIKGLQDSIYNLSSWLRKNTDYKYVIIGGGKNFENTVAWFKENFSLDNVEFLGYKENVSDWYKISKLFLHISYRDGFPKVVLEAQSEGLPVIVNNDVGMREQVVHGYNGFLIDNNNLNQLTEYVDEILKNEKLWQKLSHNCFKYVERKFSLNEISKKIKIALENFN